MRAPCVSPVALVIGALLAPALSPVGAQGVGAVTGVVLDSLGTRISGADVVIVGSAIVGRTDSSGSFLLAAPAGPAALLVRRLGYEPLTVALEVFSGETQSHALVLVARPVLVDSVLVAVSNDVSGRMGQFEARRARGMGSFITRKDIERRHPQLMSDMLRTVPGVRLERARSGRGVVDMTRNFQRSAPSICPIQLFVDGHPYRAYGFGLDNFTPDEVEALEIYRSTSEVPPEFSFGTASCGVIAVWTRDPPPKERK